MKSLRFIQDTTQVAAHARNEGKFEDSKVYVLTERRWFGEQKVQEVEKVGMTPEGHVTIIAEPPLLTFDMVLYHLRWLSLCVIGGGLVGIGMVIEQVTHR